jgi:hypothetical protein
VTFWRINIVGHIFVGLGHGVDVTAPKETVGVTVNVVGVGVLWSVGFGVSVAGKGGAVNRFNNASIPA